MRAALRWLRRIGEALGAAILCALIAFGLVQTASGRAWLEQSLAAAASTADRHLSIAGLAGLVPLRFSVERIVIADRLGAWASLRDVAVEVRAAALLAGRVEIRALTIGAVDLARLPAAGRSATSPIRASPAAAAAGRGGTRSALDRPHRPGAAGARRTGRRHACGSCRDRERQRRGGARSLPDRRPCRQSGADHRACRCGTAPDGASRGERAERPLARTAARPRRPPAADRGPRRVGAACRLARPARRLGRCARPDRRPAQARDRRQDPPAAHGRGGTGSVAPGPLRPALRRPDRVFAAADTNAGPDRRGSPRGRSGGRRVDRRRRPRRVGARGRVARRPPGSGAARQRLRRRGGRCRHARREAARHRRKPGARRDFVGARPRRAAGCGGKLDVAGACRTAGCGRFRGHRRRHRRWRAHRARRRRYAFGRRRSR